MQYFEPFGWGYILFRSAHNLYWDAEEDDEPTIPMTEEEIKELWDNPEDVYMHLHMADDSYLRVGEKYYHAKNYPGDDPSEDVDDDENEDL